MPAPPSPRPSAPPTWLGWLQLSFTTMLLVLFVVLLLRSHGQVRQLSSLQGRLTALERQRVEERAANQNIQLLSLSRRLEQLERRQEQGETAAEAEREALRQALANLRAAPRLPELGSDALPDELPPPRRRGGGALPTQPLRPPAGAGAGAGTADAPGAER